MGVVLGESWGPAMREQPLTSTNECSPRCVTGGCRRVGIRRVTHHRSSGHVGRGFFWGCDYATGQGRAGIERFGEHVTTARDRYEGRSR